MRKRPPLSPMPPRICQRCKKEFISSARRQLFCGKKHEKGTCAYEQRRSRTNAWLGASEERKENRYLRHKEFIKNNPGYQKQWLARQPESKREEYRRRYKEAQLQRRADYKRLYGISIEDFESKLAEQGGGCGICGRDTPSGKNTRLNADHCHKSGKFRGVLCTSCNVHLGWLDRRFESVLKYLGERE